MNKKVTLSDIARLAGVSKNTVSVVLRDLPGISEPVRQKVLAASEQLHYPRAEQMRAKKVNYVLVLMRRNFFGQVTGTSTVGMIPRLLTQFQVKAEERGWVVVIQCLEERDESDQQPPSILGEMQFKGIVTLGNMSAGYMRRLAACTLPLVTLHQHYDGLNVYSVTSDDVYAGYVMTRHLIKLGHTHIAYMGETHYMSKYMERWLGYCRAMHEAGLPIMENSYSTSMVERQTEEDERGLIANAFDNFEQLPTAIVCGEDFTANRVMNQLSEMGLSVPGDVSLVGVDDVFNDEGYMHNPANPDMRITTFRTDPAAIAGAAIDMLNRADEVGPHRRVIYGHIVERNSAQRIK